MTPMGHDDAMEYLELNYPEISTYHLRDARLFANRLDLLKYTRRNTKNIAEIGVALGDFSVKLIDILKPDLFVAFDTFNMHESEAVWGRPSAEIFGNRRHYEYYQTALADVPCEIKLEQGLSQELLPRYPDEFFDLIYVDGDHRYGPVMRDAENCAKAVKGSGILIFNDYIMYDHLARYPYGVVQAVNTLVVEGGWKIIGLSLHHHMFCDIAISR